MSDWWQFVQRHWILGGILTSLLWFLAGAQSFSSRQPGTALFWQSIAVFIMVVLCGWQWWKRTGLDSSAGGRPIYRDGLD